MVWFKVKSRTNPLGKARVIKKYKNGEADWDYFGGGMYANYLHEPPRRKMRAYEVFPLVKDSQESLEHIASRPNRSFELWKHMDNDFVQLAIRSTEDDIEGYAKSLGAEYVDTGMPAPTILSKESLTEGLLCFFFDYELENQLNFAAVDTRQEPVINKLIKAVNSKGCAVLIQFLFTTNLKWNQIALKTAVNLSRFLQKVERGRSVPVLTGLGAHFIPRTTVKLSPNIKEKSSTAYTIGKKVEKDYHRKAAATPVTLSIRGMIVGQKERIKAALDNISAVFLGVVFDGDFLRYCDYDVEPEHAYNWLVNNEIASKDALEILHSNQKMWQNPAWGRGRDFVPFLCLTPQEFSVFVSLPTDYNLPVRFRRQKIKSVTADKQVFPLGTIL